MALAGGRGHEQFSRGGVRVINTHTQDDADRISYIRGWAATLAADLGDDVLMRRMEAKIAQTGYWRAYQVTVSEGASLVDRGKAALRVVPEWRG